MANCIDQILCNNASDCNVRITDASGLEIDTRRLHNGDIIYLKVSDRVGYTLTGFTYKPADGQPYEIFPSDEGNGLYKIVAICGGTYVANYTVNIYELNVIPDNEIHGSTLGTGRYPYGTVVGISANENPGYHFIGWYINNVLISEDINYSYTVLDDTYIVAKFEGDQYSIVAKPNNPMLGSASGSGVYEYGTTVTLAATPFEGSTFVSWDDGDTNPTKTFTVTQNKVYTAIFKRNTYTVTVIIVNASSIRASEVCGVVTGDGTYEYGTLVSLYASPSLGFAFVSWDDGVHHVEDNTRYSFTLTGNTTIIATFNDAMYTLTLYSSPTNGGYTTNGASTASYTGGTYTYGTVVNAQALPYAGYAFDKWSDLTTTDARSFTMVSDITQTAYFVKETPRYTLKIMFDSSKGSVKIMDGLTDISVYGSNYVYATVDEGTQITAIVTEIAPYVFNRWDDSDTYGLTRTFTMDSNITREVTFSDLPEYTICICAGFQWVYGHFRATYDGVEVELTHLNRCLTVQSGTVVDIEYIKDNTYWGIQSWQTGGLGTMDYTIDGEHISITVTDNGELCANVNVQKANIVVENNPSDVLAGLIDFTIDYTGGVTQTKTPNDNYEVVGPVSIYPTPATFNISVTTPTVPGYHFQTLGCSDGSESYGSNSLYGNLDTTKTITCYYYPDGCQSTFNFDYQNHATLSISGNSYRTDVTLNVTDGEAFTITADPDYYITGVVNVTDGISIGTCGYCYNSFPFADSNGHAYYYKDIAQSAIPSGATITEIYGPAIIINSNSPMYVKLVRPGYLDAYAVRTMVDLSTQPQYATIWNDLCVSYFYNPDGNMYDDEQIPSVVGNATATSPFWICSKGFDVFYVKTKVNCTYNVECGKQYQICMLNGNYTKPTKEWQMVSVIPSSVPSSQIITSTNEYQDFAFFWYNYNPVTMYASGYRYANLTINYIQAYLQIVDNC